MTLHEEQADREHANTAKSVADTYAVLAGTAPLVDHIRHERVRRGRRVMAIESPAVQVPQDREVDTEALVGQTQQATAAVRDSFKGARVTLRAVADHV